MPRQTVAGQRSPLAATTRSGHDDASRMPRRADPSAPLTMTTAPSAVPRRARRPARTLDADVLEALFDIFGGAPGDLLERETKKRGRAA